MTTTPLKISISACSWASALVEQRVGPVFEDCAEADDDRVRDTQTKALHGNAEKNLRDTPSGTQQDRNSKLLKGQSFIRFGQVVHKNKGEHPGNDYK